MTTLSRSVLGGDSCPLLSARIQKRRSHSAAPSVRRCRRLGRRLGMVLLLRRGQAGADKVHHPRRKGRRRRGCILPQRRKGGGKNGFLIHRGLLLTTHGTIPSAAAAGAAEVRLSHGRLPARLVPQSPILDLTIIGLNIVDDDSNSHGQQPHFLKTCLNPSLDLGITVLLLGHTNRRDLAVGEGKVAIATDNLTKFSSDEVSWRPGSAMVCDPMKLALHLLHLQGMYASASSTALLASKEDAPTQFGVPIPAVCEWLKQHWSGSLEDISWFSQFHAIFSPLW